MLNGHHSLPGKVVGLALIQSAAAVVTLPFLKGATITEILMAVSFLTVTGLATALIIRRMLSPFKYIVDLTDKQPEHPPRPNQLDGEIDVIFNEFEATSRSHLERLIDNSDELDFEAAEVDAQRSESAKTENDELKSVIEALDSGLRRFAVGDLLVRIDRPFPEEFEGMRSDFNHAMTTIDELLERIGDSARKALKSCPEMDDGLKEASLAAAARTAAIAGLTSQIDALAQMLRSRRMQTAHTSGIAHNAGLDLRHPKQAIQATAVAMEAIRNASSQIEPATKVIHDIAFDANMLALNAGIEASHAGHTGDGIKVIAEEMRDLAARAADAAREISRLCRISADAAEHGHQTTEQAGREWDAMTIYVDALRGHIDAIASSSEREIEAIAGIRANALAIARTNRSQTGRMEMLKSTMGNIGREIGAIDHQAGRFAPVTIIAPGSVSAPEISKRQKPGSHLRLVKS